MGKLPNMYTDSEETEDTSSSVECAKKKKKRFSILKYSTNNVKKKNNHSKSEPDYSELRGVSSHRVRYKLPGILKNANYDNTKERESSEEDDEVDYSKTYLSKDKCVVGRVPLQPGSKPGRGGGVAILVRRNVSGMHPQQSTSNTKRRRKTKLSRKRSS